MALSIFCSKFSTICPTLFSTSMGLGLECLVLVEGDLRRGEAIPDISVRLLMTVTLSSVKSMTFFKSAAMFVVALDVPVAIVPRELLSSWSSAPCSLGVSWNR